MLKEVLFRALQSKLIRHLLTTFDSKLNEKSILRYRIGEGEWNDMHYLEEYDPIYLLEMFEWDTTTELIDGKRPSNPQKSKHLWRAIIPNKLPAGTHIIEVEAIDMFGKRNTSQTSYEIITAKESK